MRGLRKSASAMTTLLVLSEVRTVAMDAAMSVLPSVGDALVTSMHCTGEPGLDRKVEAWIFLMRPKSLSWGDGRREIHTAGLLFFSLHSFRQLSSEYAGQSPNV